MTCSSSRTTRRSSRSDDLVTARGHVVFVSGGNRIWADRMEYNTRTRTGTFYNARGSAILGDRGPTTDRSLFGTQEPEAAFWGEQLEKVGPKKYRITRGGFTTCVQPTPRWEIVVGNGHAEPRRLRVADQLAVPRQGRAADVPAGLLLSDPGRRPRHRVPDSDLRVIDRQGPDLQQRVLLGDRTQPRRHHLSRLDDQGRPAARRRIPLRARTRGTGEQPLHVPRSRTR